VNLHAIAPFSGSRRGTETHRDWLSRFRSTLFQLDIFRKNKMSDYAAPYSAPPRLRVNSNFTVNLHEFLRVLAIGSMAVCTSLNTAVAQEHDHSKMGHNEQEPTYSSNVGPCGSEMFGVSEGDGNQVDYIVPRPCIPSEGSGTSRLPARENGRFGSGHTGLHIMPGDDWMLMLHGYA
jgi:hypothetical protein